MNNRFLCPNCKLVEYYFDGQILKCPNCNQYDFESALHDSEGHILYQKLIKLNELNFELEYGETYNCVVEHNGKIDNGTIIPIVSDKKLNKVFLLFEVNYCLQYYPEVIKTVMTKTFTELWDLTVKHEIHRKYDCAIIVAANNEDNSIVSYNGWIFRNFTKSVI